MSKDLLPEPEEGFAAICQVDCSTGQQIHRPLAADERADANVEWWEGVGAAVDLEAAATAREDRKRLVLERVAESTGVTVDELREALLGPGVEASQ